MQIAYGRSNLLPADALKRANPHIVNFDRLAVGQRLRLPPLLKETLTLQQPDRSYRLVVGAFDSPPAARQFAQSIRDKGYVSVVTTYQASTQLTVSRVEIEGLTDSAAVDQAWTLVNVPQILGPAGSDKG